MRIFKLSILLISALVFISACSGTRTANLNNNDQNAPVNRAGNTAPSRPPADKLSAARLTYNQMCSKCHQENGEGGQVDDQGKKFKVPSFKRPAMAKDTDTELAEVIEKGDEEMPAFKDKLKPEEIADLVKFIRREFTATGFPVVPQ
jgi:mono/diheme cytochrome c family protein